MPAKDHSIALVEAAKQRASGPSRQGEGAKRKPVGVRFVRSRATSGQVGSVASGGYSHTLGRLYSRAEPVNDFETLTFAIYCTRTPVVGLGGLIQTASGSGLGFGHPRTKRSG